VFVMYAASLIKTFEETLGAIISKGNRLYL